LKELSEDLEANLSLEHDLDALKESEQDKYFEKFKQIISSQPDQVV
jgi:hypothetical protein